MAEMQRGLWKEDTEVREVKLRGEVGAKEWFVCDTFGQSEGRWDKATYINI